MNTYLVCVPTPGNSWADSLASIKGCGGKYVPERKCWIVPAEEREMLTAVVIGEFQTDRTPGHHSTPSLLAKIDSCADFKQVNR